MADSPNTRTLSKFHSRRTALVGIAGTFALATGAVGALAVQSSQTENNPDAGLIALCDRYMRESAEYYDAMDREGDAQSLAWDNEPDCPAELYEPLQFADGLREPYKDERAAGPAYWSRSVLECYADPQSTSQRYEVVDGDGVRTIHMFTFPVPEETRARCRYLLTLHERWDAEIEATQVEYRRLEAISQELGDRYSATLDEIVAHDPPQSPAGLLALARLALEGGMLDSGDSDVYTAVIRTVLQGVIRLNRGEV